MEASAWELGIVGKRKGLKPLLVPECSSVIDLFTKTHRSSGSLRPVG